MEKAIKAGQLFLKELLAEMCKSLHETEDCYLTDEMNKYQNNLWNQFCKTIEIIDNIVKENDPSNS